MPVNRAEISKIQGFKQIALFKQSAFDAFLYFLYKLMCIWPEFGKFDQHLEMSSRKRL